LGRSRNFISGVSLAWMMLIISRTSSHIIGRGSLQLRKSHRFWKVLLIRSCRCLLSLWLHWRIVLLLIIIIKAAIYNHVMLYLSAIKIRNVHVWWFLFFDRTFIRLVFMLEVFEIRLRDLERLVGDFIWFIVHWRFVGTMLLFIGLG
jgi:hypothetical protein